MDGTILIADDDRTIRTVLTQAFSRAGCKVHATSSLSTLMRWIEEGKGDLVISDVVMPDGDGLELLPKIIKMRPNLPVIIISAQNNIVTAVRANEAKAFDYLPKPFDLPELMNRSSKALENKKMRNLTLNVEQEKEKMKTEIPMIGRSDVMQKLYKLMARTVESNVSALIVGEPGSGKSLIAKTIHDLSIRKDKPFIILHSEMCESSTNIREAVDRVSDGTLLLEGITDLTASAQLCLLQRLEDVSQIRARILSTADTNISKMVQNGDFRNDLFHRISANQLYVPALRDRSDDIPALAKGFVARFSSKPNLVLTTDAYDALCSFYWPGNVRQLQNIIQQLAIETTDRVSDGSTVKDVLKKYTYGAQLDNVSNTDDLSKTIGIYVQKYFDTHGDKLPPPGVYQYFLKQFEGPLIETALLATAGNQLKCADLLGINRNTLRKKVSDLDILVSRGRKLM
ncbi:MAG: response regulator [Planktomarina sp.]|nr:response regulator [Planktomarina sp.]